MSFYIYFVTLATIIRCVKAIKPTKTNLEFEYLKIKF